MIKALILFVYRKQIRAFHAEIIKDGRLLGKFALSDKYINEVIESRILAEFFYRAILPGFINVLNPTASGLFTVELMRRQLFTLSVKDNLGANVEEFTGMIAAYLKSLSNYTELHMVKGKDTIN